MRNGRVIRMSQKINKVILILALLCSCVWTGYAQTEITAKSDTVIPRDSVVTAVVPTPGETAASDSTVKAVLSAADSLPQPKVKLNEFKPDPNKALLYALVPGLGQIYNKKYWKLPLVYGAFMGCMYAITWNNKNYKDYSGAYFDIMEDYSKVLQGQQPGHEPYEGPWSDSWTIFVPVGQESSYVSNTQFQENLKRRKDYFRRYRDLSIIITVGVYAISIIDAYVDAQLFDFDISPDLSMHWSPEVTPKTRYTQASYGLNCSFKF